MKKRILALLLAVVMVCGLLPVGAAATDGTGVTLAIPNADFARLYAAASCPAGCKRSTTASRILDEPTSRLNPIVASDFLATLGRINRELGTTILLTEHRLEEAFPLASTVREGKD